MVLGRLMIVADPVIPSWPPGDEALLQSHQGTAAIVVGRMHVPRDPGTGGQPDDVGRPQASDSGIDTFGTDEARSIACFPLFNPRVSSSSMEQRRATCGFEAFDARRRAKCDKQLESGAMFDVNR